MAATEMHTEAFWYRAFKSASDQRIAAERDLAAARADAARYRAASLDDLQGRVAEWHDRNFGDASQLARALIVCEEAGELAHVVLKQEQGIRPESAKDSDLRDAMGDIVIALCALAASRGWSLAECIAETAETVLQRDWTGRPCSVGGSMTPDVSSVLAAARDCPMNGSHKPEVLQQAAEQACYRYCLSVLERLTAEPGTHMPIFAEMERLNQLIAGSV